MLKRRRAFDGLAQDPDPPCSTGHVAGVRCIGFPYDASCCLKRYSCPVLLWLAIACNPSEATFYRKGLTLQCEQWQACDPDDFATYYDSVDACFEAGWNTTGNWVEAYESEGCSYDGGAARQCLADLETIECSVWNNDDTSPKSCFSVWQCQ